MLPPIIPMLGHNGGPAWPEPDPSSPFWLGDGTEPCLISFSGGRTSAYMLFCHLWAHGGRLPDHCIVAFANTGREREETLRFVHECSARWGVHIHWVEWRPPPARRKAGEPRVPLIEDAARRLEIVGFNSADRSGKWFAELIRRKLYLPNQDMRYCTTTLKIETMKHLMLSLGYTHWRNVVGLRADEPHRVLKQIERNAQARERWVSSCPLFMAGVTSAIIWRFWLGRNLDPKRPTLPLPMGFDLGLWPYEGNCDLCFLKGRGKKARIIREVPGVADWWIDQERLVKSRDGNVDTARFDKRIAMADLVQLTSDQPELAQIIDPDGRDEFDAECGVSCAGEATEGPEAFTDEAIIWLRDQMIRQIASPRRMMPRRREAAASADLFPEGAAQ